MAEPAMGTARRLPLGDDAGALTAGIAPEVLTIAALPPRARFTLRVDPALLPANGEVGGFTLEMAANRYRASAQRTALRLGPDEWLLWAAAPEAGRVTADVAAVLAGRHFSLVDICHARSAFAVAGTEAASILNSGCPLDLAPAAFPVGCATRTLIGKCEVVLARIDDQPTLEIECARSFAGYLADLLLEAARELRAGP